MSPDPHRFDHYLAEVHVIDPRNDDGGNDWDQIPLAALAAAIRAGQLEPITPTILAVDGALALFYPNRINSLFGESGGGKTWVALAAIAEVVQGGGHALYIDYEDTPAGITERLILLGLTDSEIALVDYRNPTSGIGLGLDTLAAQAQRYELVVIDSTGEAMAAGLVDSNSDREVAQWFALLKLLIRLDGAPALLILDHVPKDRDAPTSYAIGSQRKRAAVTGAAYRCDTVKEPAKGRDGKLKLTVAKDRPGNRPKGTVAAEIDLVTAGGKVRLLLHLSDAQVAAEHGQPFRPTVLMERVSRFLESVSGASARKIEQMVVGKSTGIRSAVEVLTDEGFVKVGLNGYESVEPFREAVDNSGASPASPRVPGASRDDSKKAGMGARPRVPDIHKSGTRDALPGGRDAGRQEAPRPPVDNYSDDNLFDPPLQEPTT